MSQGPVLTDEALTLTFKLDGFKEKKGIFYGPIQDFCGYKWRLKVYPKGNNRVGYLSVYITVCDIEKLPANWRFDAKMSFELANPLFPDGTDGHFKHVSQHTFTKMEEDWGFAQFCTLAELANGCLQNNSITVICHFFKASLTSPSIPIPSPIPELNVRVVNEDHLKLFQNKKELVEFDEVPIFKISSTETTKGLYQRVSEQYGMRPENFCLFLFILRQNRTIRPHELIKNSTDITIGSLTKSQELKVLLLRIPYETVNTKSLILFKQYIPERTLLLYLGYELFNSSDTIDTVFERMKTKAQMAYQSNPNVYEEVHPGMINQLVKSEQTLQNAELGTGDILIIQTSFPIPGQPIPPFPTVKDFFAKWLTHEEYLDLIFRNLSNMSSPDIRLKVSKTEEIEQVISRLALTIPGADPTTILLRGYDGKANKPLEEPFPRHSHISVSEMIPFSALIYYDLSSISAKPISTPLSQEATNDAIQSVRIKELEKQVVNIQMELENEKKKNFIDPKIQMVTRIHDGTLSLTELSTLETTLQGLIREVSSAREKKLGELEQMNKCKVCFEAEINTIFLTCHHCCCCQACASKLTACPICRMPFNQSQIAQFVKP